MKHQDTFTLWGVQEPNSGHVLDTYATREIARNACGKRYKPVKLECRIVPQSAKKPKKPKTFTSHGLKWILHTPGDPMPCDGEKMVRVLQAAEYIKEWDYIRTASPAKHWKWEDYCNKSNILGWNFAD